MDQETAFHLKSLGVTEVVCCNCLSEDFKYYKVMGNQVLFCDNCVKQLQEVSACLADQSSYLFWSRSPYLPSA